MVGLFVFHLVITWGVLRTKRQPCCLQVFVRIVDAELPLVEPIVMPVLLRRITTFVVTRLLFSTFTTFQPSLGRFRLNLVRRLGIAPVS